MPIIQDPRLRECNYGAWNGLPRSKWQDAGRFTAVPFPGGESYEDVVVRTRSFLDDLIRERDGQRVLVIAHSANRWALDHVVNGEALIDAVRRDFNWQPGWEYVVGRALG
jgi:broad specificity phosphatase PhoE